MKSRPICFDMDGVIIDSEPRHFEAFRLTFEPLGIALTHDDYQAHFAGKTDEQGFDDFLKTVDAHTDIIELQKAKRDHYEGLAATTVTPYEATIKTIRRLYPDHPLAIVTSSPLSQVEIILQRFKLSSFFSVIVTAEDITNGKPNPEGYLLAAKHLQVKPTDCYVIEDAPSGITAAKRAGMYCVAVTTTHGMDELAEADMMVDKLTPELFD